MLPWHPIILILKLFIYVLTYFFPLPDHKAPRKVTVVIPGIGPGIYSCSITVYWTDGWTNRMDGWTEGPINEEQLDHSFGHHQRAAPYNQIGLPSLGRADLRSSVHTPTQPLRQEGRPPRRCNTHAAPGSPGSSFGQEEVADAGLAHTQHADAQHEGVHSIGHDSRPPPGRASR